MNELSGYIVRLNFNIPHCTSLHWHGKPSVTKGVAGPKKWTWGPSLKTTLVGLMTYLVIRHASKYSNISL